MAENSQTTWKITKNGRKEQKKPKKVLKWPKLAKKFEKEQKTWRNY